MLSAWLLSAWTVTHRLVSAGETLSDSWECAEGRERVTPPRFLPGRRPRKSHPPRFCLVGGPGEAVEVGQERLRMAFESLIFLISECLLILNLSKRRNFC